jgi:hypothetical protein
MTKRREPTDGELALWTEVMRDVRRNNKRRRVSKLKPSEPVRKAKDPVLQATVTRATAGEKKPAQTVEKKPPPQAGLGVGHGGVWRYMYMHKPTEGEN